METVQEREYEETTTKGNRKHKKPDELCKSDDAQNVRGFLSYGKNFKRNTKNYDLDDNLQQCENGTSAARRGPIRVGTQRSH